MFIHPQFDPVALRFGNFGIHWYGLMYLLGFVAFMILGRLLLKRRPDLLSPQGAWQISMIDDLLFYGAMGVVLGGRLGYVLFYKPAFYFSHPEKILAVWEGDMAFHGGLLGVMAAMWLFGRKYKITALEVLDFIAPLVPPGLFFGRIGNFINGELWGRETQVPWSMLFPQANDGLFRHPSQLYQAATEGLLLFIVLWWFSGKSRPLGQTAGLGIAGYGLMRFLVEFTREPDSFLGLLSLGLSMGQWLCVPMVGIGLYLMLRAKK